MSSEKKINLDTVSSTLFYVGYAAMNISESDAFWKIKRVQTTGTVLKVEWADGNEGYDNVWANRASLSYS